MKTNKIFSTVAAAALILCSSCYDLDRYPDSKMSSGTFFKTEAHAKAAMMAVYAQMHNDDVFGLRPSMDALGGVACGYDNYAYQVFQRGTYASTNAYISRKWNNLYEGVARANNVIRNIGTCDMSDDLKAQYVAEARFMRGIYYTELLSFFGGVPLYDETTNIATDFNQMLKPRASVEDTRKFILDDFDAALVLPKTWATAETGRATWGAAMSMKGKTYLYAKNYTEAEKCFNEVIKSNVYDLYNNYYDLFQPKGHNSSEMIFTIQNLGGVGQDFGMPTTFYLGSRSSFGSCWNNVMAAITTVDSFEWNDGRPFSWEEFMPGKTSKEIFSSKMDAAYSKVIEYTPSKDALLAMYDQRDPRMKASVILPYTTYNGWVSNKAVTVEYVVPLTATGANGTIPNNSQIFLAMNGGHYVYAWRKFVAEGNMDGKINNRADTPINFPLVRYADVLLMEAECLNEMNRQDDAVNFINQVRNRESVNMPGINSGPAYLKATTKDEVFARIRHERMVEL
ncbi:MAG: RagB/SusD family nutrient uptake outer membrane protein, partial [Muribaculaceae bacterium]|nr:RagB/SusD family nutrient uptake outer membrane protein [Muribaculaceae bacterium]